jgi:hypothetical protein
VRGHPPHEGGQGGPGAAHPERLPGPLSGDGEEAVHEVAGPEDPRIGPGRVPLPPEGLYRRPAARTAD